MFSGFLAEVTQLIIVLTILLHTGDIMMPRGIISMNIII